jgi:DNA repair protein RecO (recombination protein O)
MSTDGRIALQPAYILHRKPYRDTSLLLEAFTPEYGRIGLVARGARGRRSSQQAILQPFQPLLLSWSGRGELFTLTSAESDGIALGLAGDAVLSGFYINELIMRLLPRHDPHAVLYANYRNTLEQMHDDVAREWLLRLFERDLLQELGYALLLTHDAQSGEALQPDAVYCYYPEYGPQRLHDEQPDCLAVLGSTLLALDSGECTEQRCLREAKRLMRTVLQRYLGNRPLASRELFKARYAFSKKYQPTDDNKE